MRRRIWVVILSVIMILTLLPAGVMADEVALDLEEEVLLDNEAEAADLQEEELGDALLFGEEMQLNETNPGEGGLFDENDFVTGYVQDDIPALSIYDANYQHGFSIASGTKLPSSYSSVDKNYISRVKIQGSFQLCWAFAVIAAAEASLVAQGKASPGIDLSERHLAYFTFHEQEDPLGNLAGTYSLPGRGVVSADVGNDSYLWSANNVFSAMQTLASWKGATDENAVEGDAGTNYELLRSLYEDANKKDADSMNEFYSKTAIDGTNAFSRDAWHLTGVYDISFDDASDVKKSIMKYGAAAVALNMSPDVNYEGDDCTCYNDRYTDSNHLVAIVGWDDNFDKNKFVSNSDPSGEIGHPENNGAWLIKNSWTSAWGNNGYCWISYEDLCLHQNWSKAWFFDFEDADNYDNNYQYDGSGAWYYNYVNSGGSVANVFETSANPGGSELLEAVSFTMTNDVNVNYSIQVYTGLTDPANPTSGTPMMNSPTIGKTSYAGYYTVKLDEPVSLPEDEQFAVVITFSHADGTQVHYDVDRADDSREEFTFYHEARADRSFERDSDKSEWDDLSSSIADNHDESCCTARIKAFTSNEAEKTQIAKTSVGKIADQTYTGKRLKPSFVVKVDGSTLKAGTDYTVTYAKNLNAGTATVLVRGKGNYFGKVKKTFKINPKGTSIASLSTASKAFTVKWKKQATQTTGYQIQYSSSKTFHAKKTVTVGRNTVLSKKIGSLKSGRTYYVRVRTFKKVDGKNYYSGWSAVKSVKAK